MIRSLFFSGLLVLLGFNSIAQESMNVNLVYHWSDPELPASLAHNNTYNEIWGYAADGREYAIIGSTMGTHLFDLTDPFNVGEEIFIAGEVQGYQIVHRDYHDYNGYLYVVCDEGPSTLQIIDLSGLPNEVEVVYDSNELFFRSHNIFIDEANARLYVCGGNQQLDIYSLEDPTDPQLILDCQSEIENWSQVVGYVHDIYVEDNIAYCNAENSMWVVDFTDTENPVFLGDIGGYAEAGYNHSGWLRPDGNYYAMADETHGTRLKMVDVTNPADMEIVSWFGTESHEDAIAHNLIFENNLLHVSYYHDGYQVWDTTDPENPERVAYYDTSDEPHTTNYRGCWGIYPFLPSGLVLASDMQEGLFVFEIDIASSVEERDLIAMKAFPNPSVAGQKVFFNGPETGSNFVVELFDLNGRSVMRNELISNTGSIASLDLAEDLESGIYLLRIFADEKSGTAKIVVR